MTLELGTQLGTYEIDQPLGAGGMGEVYRARDIKLDRYVAVKVLPESLADDTERLARFEREAKALAALNHPNVATVHGFERDEKLGANYLVMELVDGEDLSERIRRGSLKIEEALPIFVQIARGLEAAHERGIVHRDLKPGNVKLTTQGSAGEPAVKILDFGLATALQPPAGQGADQQKTHSPTLTLAATQRGQILGTAPYMSPEQARGLAVDKRTDIWAFGVCLFESITGERVFDGEDVSSTLAKVIEAQPPWHRLPAHTPTPVRTLLRRCLAKAPGQRLRDIGDARLELEDVSAWSEPTVAAAGWTAARRWRSLSLLLAAVTASALLFAAWPRDGAGSAEAAPRPLRRFTIVLPESEPLALTVPQLLGTSLPALALSRDGGLLTYVVRHGDSTRLRLRSLGARSSEALPGTEGGFAPFFSPDGRWIGFATATQLSKVAVDGGPPTTLADIDNFSGAVWLRDGSILVAQSEGKEVVRVPEDGGRPEPLLEARDSDDFTPFWRPRVVSDERVALFSSEAPIRQRVIAVSLETKERTILLENATGGRPVPTGHLLFARDRGLSAVSFDPVTLTVGTQPRVVLESVSLSGTTIQLAMAEDGTIAYVPGGSLDLGTFAWVSRDGAVEPLPFGPESYGTFQISPGGDRVAAQVWGTNLSSDIWIYDLRRETKSRLTVDGRNGFPVWDPSGSKIVYLSGGADDVGAPRVLEQGVVVGAVTEISATPLLPFAWSRNGSVVAGSSLQGRDDDVLAIRLEESPIGASRETFDLELGNDVADEWGPQFSPNGRFIAYTSNESGAYQVYVQPFPPNGERWMVSSSPGSEEPRWSHGGDELYFRNGNRWKAVEVETSDEFSHGAPALLFEGPYVNVTGHSYDIGPDGRFLVIVREEAGSATEIHVDLNWFDELERLVPDD